MARLGVSSGVGGFLKGFGSGPVQDMKAPPASGPRASIFEGRIGFGGGPGNPGQTQQNEGAGEGKGEGTPGGWASSEPSGSTSTAEAKADSDWDASSTSDLDAIRSVFDSNGNGLLDAGDARWSSFRIVVINADGITIGCFFAPKISPLLIKRLYYSEGQHELYLVTLCFRNSVACRCMRVIAYLP